VGVLYYGDIRPEFPSYERVAERLGVLRAQLDGEIPDKNLESSVLLATWNIREFDAASYGARLEEAIVYIAEIISRFDLVAVQEVRADLTGLDRLMQRLGSDWSYFVTDITEGDPGNEERLAFVYDTRTVAFNGIAGQLVLPPLTKKEGGKTVGYIPVEQIARTPFFVSFTSGWTKFVLATVHVVYGDNKANDPERIKEIGLLAQALAERGDDASRRFDNLVLLGDFNIYAVTDDTMKALTDAGWVIPDAIQALPGSNVPKNQHYDQIALRPHTHWFELTGHAGVFDYYQSVFRDDDQDSYAPDIGDALLHTDDGKLRDAKAQRLYYRTYWRTFQMSDHLPMWIEIRTDYSSDYLAQQREAAPI
jgi:endonuclease/exonuclease/phosphatase family metal-dependent hydrolase